MKISYIPAVAAPVASTSVEMGVLEEAIHHAIQSTIVDPFTNWCTNAWLSFMNGSHYICLFVAMGGTICWICGFEKGKKVAIGAVLVYIGLRIINIFILG